MTDLSPFWQGALAAALLSVGGQGLYWFIGSNAADVASTARVTAVAVQAFVGSAGGLWLLVRHIRQVPRPQI